MQEVASRDYSDEPWELQNDGQQSIDEFVDYELPRLLSLSDISFPTGGLRIGTKDCPLRHFFQQLCRYFPLALPIASWHSLGPGLPVITGSEKVEQSRRHLYTRARLKDRHITRVKMGWIQR